MPEEFRILLVEDEPVIQELVASMLTCTVEGREVSVLVSGGGAEGLAQAKRERPDLVLLDIVLPDLDGIAVCRLIKSDSTLSHTKVCMLTARASDHDHLAASNAGADAYIEKPFKGLELIALVERFVRGEL